VQLKDKWRNLVKFRHVAPDETQAQAPKTSGPWHKKHGGGGGGGGDGGSADAGGSRCECLFVFVCACLL
jgi:hypothetical protein